MIVRSECNPKFYSSVKFDGLLQARNGPLAVWKAFKAISSYPPVPDNKDGLDMMKADIFWGPLMKLTREQTPFNVLRVHRYLIGDLLRFWQHSIMSIVHFSRQTAESVRNRTGFTNTPGGEC